MIGSLLAVGFGLAAIAWLGKARTPAVLANGLILFGLTYRTIDVGYLDAAGPVYSIQLEKFVGGNGGAPFFVASVLCFVIPAAVLFRSSALVQGVVSPLPDHPFIRTVSRAGFFSVAALLSVLYGNMLRVGTIPLFTGMDRLEYGEIAGIVHRGAYGLGFLPAAMIGILTVIPRLQGRSFHIPSILLFIILLVYWALTGNRFSAFVLAVCFYAMPFGAVVALRRLGALVPVGQNDPWLALLSPRVILPIFGVLATVAFVGLLINSYYEVRNYADPVFEIFQRIFVQPVEIFGARWELVLTGRMDGLNWAAIDEVLLYPVDASGNTTIRFLMIQEIGYFRATELIDFGTQYAGGYPEIFFELFGTGLALPLMLLVGTLTAALSRFVVRNVMRGYILSAILAVYVFFAFNLVYVGGMLNSLIAPTLALKILALLVVNMLERRLIGRETSARVAPKAAQSSRGNAALA